MRRNLERGEMNSKRGRLDRGDEIEG